MRRPAEESNCSTRSTRERLGHLAKPFRDRREGLFAAASQARSRATFSGLGFKPVGPIG